MHLAITLGAFALGVVGTTLALRVLVRSSLRPRPFLIVASMGLSSALLLSFYAGNFAAQVLGLMPPQWFIVAMAIGIVVLGPALVTAIAFSFTRRNINVHYRQAWLYSFLIVFALCSIVFLPMAP